MDQREKVAYFRDLHRPGNPFILANAYDGGSAKVVAAVGGQAVGTTSAGFAFTVGHPDGGIVSREQAIAHCEMMVKAVDIPVTGDLENGYADDPDGVAACISLGSEVGLVGGCIEDTVPGTGSSYGFTESVDRIAAAAEAAKATTDGFYLCARADGVLEDIYEVDEAIERCVAFEKVGADMVYVPGLKRPSDLARLCAAVSVPVNALYSAVFTGCSLDEFGQLGAARVSIGGGLARLTHRTLLDASRAMLERGQLDVLADGATGTEVNPMLRPR